MIRRGFSLAEVVVAAGLLLLVLHFVFSPLATARQSVSQASGRLAAIGLARSLLAEARRTAFDELQSREGQRQVVLEHDGKSRSTSFSYQLAVEELSSDLKSVRAVITWGPRRLELGTPISRRRGEKI
ncbi:MAG: hypothetical protein HY319_14225 [Armatimonadetes bacterium]|nr:hypothetical protein [Armatimonadota bacterium]